MAPSNGKPEFPAGAASILLLTCGQLEYTRQCLASVLRWTKPPFEIVVLDAGALDGTREFLEGIALASPAPVSVVTSGPDEPLHKGVQECLRRARGDNLVLLQNDTIVVSGWLQQLAALARMDPTIGIVGPMSCAIPPPQGVDKLPYAATRCAVESSQGARIPAGWRVAPEEVDKFAREHREQLRGKWFEVNQLASFCLYVTRAASQLLQFEEDSGLGFFHAAKACAQVRAGGFKVTMCRDLFIHHFGTRVSVPRSSS